MTGFGSSNLKNKLGAVSVQIKTVNNRYFEVKFRMPRAYQSFESELRNQIHKKIHRGSVDVTIQRSHFESGNLSQQVVANEPLAKSWLQATQKLAKKLKIKGSVSLEMLLKVPDVFVTEENLSVSEEEKILVEAAVKEAVDKCLTERRREGAALQKDLLQWIGNLEDFSEGTEKKSKDFESQIEKNLRKKIKKLSEELTVDPHRLSQEALFLMEKSDITEEITRLKTHLSALKNVLSEKPQEAVGRKLDFMIQELHREVNTISAKVQSLEISLDVVEAKTVIEKLREQAQNIE